MRCRMSGTFIVLHDKYGFVQARLPEGSQFKDLASSIKDQDVLKVVGTVTSRGKDLNPDMKTGDIDVSYIYS